MDEGGLRRWYRDQTVLLTGGTGFLGKIVTEKLLRTCSLSRLYLLIRPKKGKDVQQRIKEHFQDPVFERLKSEVPNYQDLVSVVEGDISLEGLGLSDLDKLALTEQVTTVIHGAATVRFDETLKVATDINVRGTKQILTLCRQMDKLQAVVHVSTAYSNCMLDEIHEKFYNSPISGDNLLQLVDCLSEAQLDSITPQIVGPWPNTYTFTKAVAEETVKTHGKGLPVAIVRPSIVVGTHEEPVKGWVDNMYGPTGVIAAVGAGLMRVILLDVQAKADLVPVDLCANAILAIARKASKRLPEIRIFNYTSGKQNPISWQEFFNTTYRWGTEIPNSRSVWYVTLTTTTSRSLFNIYSFLYHFLPALIIDTLLMARNKKPSFMKIYIKIHKIHDLLSKFSLKKWEFHNYNTRELLCELSQEDKKLFNFDVETVVWDDYLKHSIVGVWKYVLKEGPETIKEGKRRQFWFRILHYLLKYVLLSFLFWICWKTFAAISPLQII